ncbi:ESF1 homolog [Dysidea avara]|uniref:ESF1 homolog n=1 Tax=Dysidea avara TaxID=196820 RepID=UPI00332C7350
MAAKIESDPRFKHVLTDPRFKKAPRHVRKVTIDPRFKAMFNDKRFKVKYSVDKRGRKIKQTSSEDLRKYYALGEDNGKRKDKKKKTTLNNTNNENDSDKDDDQDDVDNQADSGDNYGQEINQSDQDDSQDDDDADEQDDDVEGPIDYARGEGNMESSSSESEEAEDEDDKSELLHSWGELDDAAPLAESTSSWLAVCNMNWDRITAQDLYVLFNSFKPQGSVIVSVMIYPSDFGLERMANEEIEGPVELTKDDGGDVETTEGGGYSVEKLRQYQLNRLKYYYAVVECDSPATAEALYNQCDGLEYEHSSSLLDLRFIPSDINFDNRAPTSTCTDITISKDFRPSDFCTTALQRSSVQLTWDETDPKRVETMSKKFNKNDVMEMDFQAYLASSSDDDDDDHHDDHPSHNVNMTEEEKIASYRALLMETLNEDKQSDHEQEIEITFEPGLQETAEEMVQRKLAKDGSKDLTTWETYLKEKKLKRKQRIKEAKLQQEEEPSETSPKPPKKRKRGKLPTEEPGNDQQKSELELLMMDNDDDGKEHFNLKGILKKEKESAKKKRKKKRDESAMEEIQDSFKMDVNDPRFLALYESHEYALDPSNPQYKPTKGMSALVEEAQRQRREKPVEKITTKPATTKEPSVEALVRSVKAKVAQHAKAGLKQSRRITHRKHVQHH